MPQIKLKLPKKLQRVEIIPSVRASINNPYVFREFTKNEYPSLADELLDSDEYLKKKSGSYYYEESFLPSFSGLIQLDLSKVQNLRISFESLQEEIQHAYDRGFDEAQQLTRTTFEIELQKRQHWILNFDSIFADMKSQLRKELASLEDSLVELSVTVAEHIIEQEVTKDNNIVLNQVRKIIRNIDNEEILKIRVHPYNYEVLKESGSDIINENNAGEKILIISDEKVEQGSCIIETNVGTLDATFHSQLAKMKEALIKSSSKVFEETNRQFDVNENPDLIMS